MLSMWSQMCGRVSGLWSTLQGLSFTTPSPTKTTEHQNGFSKHQHVFFPFFGINKTTQLDCRVDSQKCELWPRLQKINFHFPSPLLPKQGRLSYINQQTQIFEKRQIWSEISWRSISLKITLE